MIKRVNYQDAYNPLKVWQVSHLKGGFYLKQFIAGVQVHGGLRCTKEYIRSIGILSFKQVTP